ncbi:MAG: hypothetical protein WCP22_12365 [Chlamydiota bacterium]
MKSRATFITALIFTSSLAVFSYGRSRLVHLDSAGPAQVHLLTGDEPSYLLIAHSLVADGDLNLYNNCVARDGRYFGMEKAGGHAARRDLEKRLVYSIHTPGLPLLIAPAYAYGLNGTVAPRTAVCLFMNFLAALLAVNVWLFCRDLSRIAGCASPWPALLSTAAVMLTPPVVFYANLVYPELPAALFILYAFRHAFPRAVSFDPGSPNRGTGEPGNRRTDDIRTDDNDTLESPTRPLAHSPSQLLSSLCIAALPWLSFRFFLPAFVLAALLVQRGRAARSTRRWFALSLALPLLASLALFFAYQHRAFGSFSPDAGYVHQHYASWRLSGLRMLDGIFGIALDTGHGILTWSPVYILSLTGLFLLFRERRPVALWMSVLILVIYFPAATFVFWWGGFAPPPRYMVVPAPFLGAALCYALSRKPRAGFLAACGFLLGISLLVGYLGLKYPDLLYRHKHLVTHYHIRAIVRLFPSFMRKDMWTWPLAIWWLSVILALNGFFSFRWKEPA